MYREQRTTCSCAFEILTPKCSTDSTSIDADKGKTAEAAVPRLNSIVLLRILSYADAETVCRFSRTCSWAKKFIDENIIRLPRQQLAYGRIIINPSTTVYDLTVHSTFRIRKETRTFDLEAILSEARYVVKRNFCITCESIKPTYFRNTLEIVLSVGAIPDLIWWKQPQGSFCVAHSCFNSDASFLVYLRNLITKPLEALVAENDEADSQLRDIVAFAFQSSFYTELNFCGFSRTKEECFTLFAEILKVVVNNRCIRKAGILRGFPKVMFCTTEDKHPGFTREERSFLVQQIEESGLSIYCKLRTRLSHIVPAMSLEVFHCSDDQCIEMKMYTRIHNRMRKLVVQAVKNHSDVIQSLQIHMGRPAILQSVMDELDQSFCRIAPQSEKDEILRLILTALEKYPEDVALQNSGSLVLSLFLGDPYLGDDRQRSIVTVLMNVIEARIEEKDLVENCIEPMTYVLAGPSLALDCGHAARILSIVVKKYMKEKVGENAVQVLRNISAVHEERWQFRETGSIEAVLGMLNLKEESGVCDDCFRSGWNFLLNITDTQHENSECFIEAGGLSVFWKSYNKFCQPSETYSRSCILGVMSNISKVKKLRRYLMTQEYMNLFCTLATAESEITEEVQMAACIVIQLISDGDEAWACLTLSRQLAMEKIIKALQAWDINKRHSVNYNSLECFYEFIVMHDSLACQHWAAWTLANLTSTESYKYCPLLRNEGGMILLDQVQRDARTTDDIRTLISIIRDNVAEWLLRRGLLAEEILIQRCEQTSVS